MQKLSSAFIPLVVLENLYKLDCFLLIFFACFHYVVVLLLFGYHLGLCAFV